MKMSQYMHLKTQDLNLTVRNCQPFNRIVATPQVTSGTFSSVHLLFAFFRRFPELRVLAPEL
jgi:hypothetical protein